MRKISVNAIRGNELLARDIYSINDRILLPAGVIVKREYISHLLQLNITDIFVEDEFSRGVFNQEGGENSIQEQCIKQVRETLNRFVYNDMSIEKELYIAVEEVVRSVLDKKEVLYNISGVRSRSEQLYCHSISVCALSVLLAYKLKLSKQKIKEIAIGSILHDIGYKHVALDFMNLNQKTLSVEQKKEIRKHVIYGYQMVERETWLSNLSKEMILGHHELGDKSGYPFRLDSEHIKLPNKIVALCNHFDNLVYGKYHKGMKVHEVMEYIVSNSEIKFDRRVVEVFIESIAAYPNGTLVRTNEGELGIVLRQNKGLPARPVLRIIQDKNGERLINWVEKDLKKSLTLFIEDTLEKI